MFFHSNGFEVNGINDNRMVQDQDYTVDEASLPNLTPIIFASDHRCMWSGVILMEDGAFTSCQFWPLFLDFFVQFH